MSAPDFLAVGHLTLDHFPGGETRPGGAALYAALTAHRLGLSAGILTSHGVEFPLELLPPQIEVVTLEAGETTAFEHGRRDGARALRVTGRARPLSVHDVPADWVDAPLVLLAPVLDEVDPALAHAFPEATVAAAAQGWLREAGPDGDVIARPWTPPPEFLAAVQVLFVSTEDILGQEEQANRWIQRLPLAVITAAAAGALLYVNGDRFEVQPRPAREVDDTGAGDVFAATFVTRYHRDGDPWEAAAAAACAASLSVEAPGWASVPDAAALERALAAYRAEG